MNSSTTTTDPARESLSGNKLAVFEAFATHGVMTDDDLVTRTGIVKGTASPRRNDLVRLGILEEVGTTQSARGRAAKQYAIVPPERREDARELQQGKKARRRALKDFSLEERLEMARQLLDMDDVNAVIRQSNGRAWSRLRGRSQDRQGERRRQVHENEAALKDAQRQGAPIVEFYKLRRVLLESAERVRGVRRLVDEELRRTNGQGRAISVSLWPEVADLLTDLRSICDDTNEDIRAVMGVLGDDVIEGVAIEVDFEVPELPEG